MGKAEAMEMCLTGRNMDAKEAEASGLVARVVPLADLDILVNNARKQVSQAAIGDITTEQFDASVKNVTDLDNGFVDNLIQFWTNKDRLEGKV